ncbi:rhodanese-like domain-containing protein [Halopseudomonas pachastrellae]|nr:rhodanese-like domain-containing protein [Halopseudomonas pachastrellae]
MQFLQHLIEFIGNHYLLTSAFLIVLALLLFTEGRKSGKAVSTGEATTLINRENAVVVDLRLKKDFSAGHIVDSLNIPYESLTSRMGEWTSTRASAAAGVRRRPARRQLRQATQGRRPRKRGTPVRRHRSWRSDNLPLVK